MERVIAFGQGPLETPAPQFGEDDSGKAAIGEVLEAALQKMIDR